MYVIRQNIKLGLLTYKHSAYVKQIYGRRCWIARIIYDYMYFYLIEDAYALVEIIYIYMHVIFMPEKEAISHTIGWIPSNSLI